MQTTQHDEHIETVENMDAAPEQQQADLPAPAETKPRGLRGLAQSLRSFIAKHRKVITVAVTAVALAAFVGTFIWRAVEKQDVTAQAEPRTYAVRTQKIVPQGQSVSLYYVGSMQPAVMESVVYDNISTITAIYVEPGDEVYKGQAIAQVDPDTAQSEVDVAKSSLDSANAAHSRAKINYDQALSDYEDAKARLEADPDRLDPETPTQLEVDRLGREKDIAKTTLDEAASSKSGAQSTYDQAVDTLNDCTLRAGMSGYIISVPVSVGDVASPLTPAAIIGSYESVAVFGVSATDMHSLSLEQNCTITFAGEDLQGVITDISRLPDSESRTYETTVSVPVEGETFLIGEIVSVKIEVGQKTGIWIPISVILNDGEDYVFLVEDGHAVKKTVRITDVANDMACVSGLEAGGFIVVDGMKALRSGSLVSVVE